MWIKFLEALKEEYKKEFLYSSFTEDHVRLAIENHVQEGLNYLQNYISIFDILVFVFFLGFFLGYHTGNHDAIYFGPTKVNKYDP